jgi:hypothetical protein
MGRGRSAEARMSPRAEAFRGALHGALDEGFAAPVRGQSDAEVL